jgi:type I restriction enzyme R subunit
MHLFAARKDVPMPLFARLLSLSVSALAALLAGCATESPADQLVRPDPRLVAAAREMPQETLLPNVVEVKVPVVGPQLRGAAATRPDSQTPRTIMDAKAAATTQPSADGFVNAIQYYDYRTIVIERPERDAKGKVVLSTKGKSKGQPVPDADLRDTENVPLNEDVEAYFKREVLPHAPDAWIDHEKTKVGYEIPFRAAEKGITYVAFTATPKTKTMELFGTRPDPARPPGPDNVPAPFHVYSMRQAIEEKFILDVLQNYTPYKLAFRLAHNGKEYDDATVERAAAMKGIMGWVRLHPYNIAQKVQVVVEHYRELVAPLLGGRAKAMVVVASRKEAVRWKLAIEKYVRDRGYKIGTVVAFSGEVADAESGPDPFTEHSQALNPSLRGRDIREAFKGDEYQVLLVANKYQTGFDQPLLCGMYVDKRLAGIQAVQTLSRLNRAHPGKATTYVVDFVNDTAEVLAAFKTYYATAALSATTDPNLVYDLRAKLDAAGHYDDFEVDRVVAAELKPGGTQGDLLRALEPVADRLLKRYKAAQADFRAAAAKGDEGAAEAAKGELDALTLFRSDMAAFVRLYTFLSQIFDYGNTAVEKRAIFYRRLLPLLEFGREREGIDLSQVVLTHHTLRNLGRRPMPLGEGDAPPLAPIAEAGSGTVQEKETARLAEIIQKVNDLFTGELTDQDKLVYVNNVIKGKLLESATLQQQAASNTKEQFANSPDLKAELLTAIMGALDAHNVMSTQALNSHSVQEGIKDLLLTHAGLWETLRARAV